MTAAPRRSQPEAAEPNASEMATQLAREVIEYVGGRRPDPQFNTDLQLWELATRLLKVQEAQP